ncbi:RES family NAD+ phosphorylase [Sphingopyxis solisilvae]|uniref:RES family NAD+ phosphorylase n=1 Tax=Sphingopyxis solisilvae TaxID=1886788 RepID=UPI00189293FE|nr:RES family NAD+ phosphorylase [Sphingopyxis solisilvae]
MTVNLTQLRRRITRARVVGWPRILPSRHRATPADAGFGSSRFSSPSSSFRVLYAAQDFPTAFAEAVVRDRFQGRKVRYLYRPHLEQLCVTEIASASELALLDLRGGATYEAGIDTDSSRARLHLAGQELSEAVHAELLDVDGILFDSRLTGNSCVAIYDRAFASLSGSTPLALIQASELSDEISRLGIVVRRRRGYRTA